MSETFSQMSHEQLRILAVDKTAQINDLHQRLRLAREGCNLIVMLSNMLDDSDQDFWAGDFMEGVANTMRKVAQITIDAMGTDFLPNIPNSELPF
jgi:hypothetical protein